MLSLDSQRSSFNIVLSDMGRCKASVQSICDGMSSLGFIYYACLHDKDKDEKGSLKRPHMHIVICSMKRLRVKQVIRYFEDIAQTNFENVRVEENISLVSSVQYLLHINDCNKFQYSRSELLSNQQDNADALLIETPKTNELTTTTLIDLIFNQRLNRLELIGAIGIGKYQHYRHTINDLYEYADRKTYKQKQ